LTSLCELVVKSAIYGVVSGVVYLGSKPRFQRDRVCFPASAASLKGAFRIYYRRFGIGHYFYEPWRQFIVTLQD